MEENLESNISKEEKSEEKIDNQKRQMQEYEVIQDKLKSIEDKISNEDLSMDESLELYEEAVNLGMKASQTVENNVLVNLADENDDNKDDNEE